MPSSSLVEALRSVQRVARDALSDLAQTIRPADTEAAIAVRATEAMRTRGIADTWYHDCPALVLLGSNSCRSTSGKLYRPTLECVGEFNLITVDLSPRQDDCCGDCARSFFVEDGRVTPSPRTVEFKAGAELLRSLHAEMRRVVRPEMTFHDLAAWSTRSLAAAGYENLDFRQNVGHSTAGRRAERLYIEAGNCEQLGAVDFFTFEPHVRAVAGSWGFKYEEIYFFGADGRVHEL